jgi:hypothetical protein
MSLRKRSVSDGNGPAVSFGVTAHAALVDVVVVEVDDDDEGEAGLSPHPYAKAAAAAAPMAPRASRRVRTLASGVEDFVFIEQTPFRCCRNPRGDMLEKCSEDLK